MSMRRAMSRPFTGPISASQPVDQDHDVVQALDVLLDFRRAWSVHHDTRVG